MKTNMVFSATLPRTLLAFVPATAMMFDNCRIWKPISAQISRLGNDAALVHVQAGATVGAVTG